LRIYRLAPKYLSQHPLYISKQSALQCEVDALPAPGRSSLVDCGSGGSAESDELASDESVSDEPVGDEPASNESMSDVRHEVSIASFASHSNNFSISSGGKSGSFHGFDDVPAEDLVDLPLTHTSFSGSLQSSPGRSSASKHSLVGLCKGCHFETRIESECNSNANFCVTSEMEMHLPVNCDVLATLQPIQDSWLDKTLSSPISDGFLGKCTMSAADLEEDWELSSVDSQFMVDESQEETDVECSLSPRTLPVISDAVYQEVIADHVSCVGRSEASNFDAVTAVEYDEEFHGFPAFEESARKLAQLKSVTETCVPSKPEGKNVLRKRKLTNGPIHSMQTRSRGPVYDDDILI
jgi:hypothetical protein